MHSILFVSFFPVKSFSKVFLVYASVIWRTPVIPRWRWGRRDVGRRRGSTLWQDDLPQSGVAHLGLVVRCLGLEGLRGALDGDQTHLPLQPERASKLVGSVQSRPRSSWTIPPPPINIYVDKYLTFHHQHLINIPRSPVNCGSSGHRHCALGTCVAPSKRSLSDPVGKCG